MDVTTAAGAEFWIGDIADSHSDEPMEAGSFKEVELITYLGEIGAEPSVVEHTDAETLRVRRQKSSIDNGVMLIRAGHLVDDPGQAAMREAAGLEAEFRFKCTVAGKTRHFIGEVLSAIFTIGSGDEVLMDTYRVAINSAVVKA